MEVIKQGSDIIYVVGPLSCCFPVGTLGRRTN